MELSLVSMLPVAASIVQAVLNGAEFVSHATAANAATIVGNVNGSWTLLARLGDVRNDRVGWSVIYLGDLSKELRCCDRGSGIEAMKVVCLPALQLKLKN